MPNLIRYTKPSQFDDLLRSLLWKPVGMMEEGSEMAIKTDVTEDDKTYFVKAELPGVRKEDIEVTINGRQLFIKAEIKQEKEQKKGEKVVHSERYHGQIYRGFTFDQETNAAAAHAKYENGVLHLILPKKTGAHSKHLKIQ
jgi:HSP20 family protein